MADRLTDYAYADDKKETVDVINLLLLGWILLGLVVYILGNIIATQIRKRKLRECAEKASESPDSPCAAEPTVCKAAEIQPTTSAAPLAENFREKAVISTPEVPAIPSKDSSIPVCTGDDSDIVEWINKVFLWIYKNRIVSPILEPWLTSLNSKTRLLSTEHGILVDFQNVLQSDQPPVFSEVLESKGFKSKVYATCEAEISNLSFDILVTQVKDKDKNVYKFILKLERLAGQLSIECVPEELLFHLQFPENAQVQLNIEPEPSTKIPDEELEPLRCLVCDIASNALSSSPVDLQFSSFPECPRYRRIELSISNALAESLEKEKEEKLLVKIVKANNLGGERGCSKPYCVVEMDEPPQKFETHPIEYKSNSLWEESHIFLVKDITAELLFEVYDKDRQPKENFLGLGIVSVEELMKNPSQRQIIPLQPRPLEKDDVTGSLTVEFLFLGWDLPSPDSCMLGQSQMIMEEGSGKIIETNSRVTARGTIITTTTIKRTKEGFNDSESMVNPKESPEQIHKELIRVITDSRQKFLNELIHDRDSSKNHVLTNHIENSTCNANHMNNMHDYVKACNGIHKEVKIENGCYSPNCVSGLNHDSKEDHINNNTPNNKPSNNSTKCVQVEEKCLNGHVEIIANGHVEILANGCIDLQKADVVHVNGNVVHDPHDIEQNHNNPENLGDSKEMHDHDENEISKQENNSANLPRILEETVDLSASTSTLVANAADDEADDLTGTALKELGKQDKSASPSVSTLIIHSVQKDTVQPNMKVKKDESGMWQEVAEPESSGTDSPEASPASYPSIDSHSSPQVSLPPSPSVQRNGVDRSRPKEKKSLISNLKKKLSFRKPRSRSVEQQREESSPTPLKANNRSISTERVKSGNIARPLLAVPGSSRSSFSEASGLSTASSRTYINENSTLVVELNENGIIKRYLIPTSMIHRSKWKKKGTKLHLYNDHVFVAKHISSNTLCQVCKKNLTRRPGKQGYECRDCSLQCHKSCHVKVADFCPNSSVSSMEVEYIHDPRASGKPKSI